MFPFAFVFRSRSTWHSSRYAKIGLAAFLAWTAPVYGGESDDGPLRRWGIISSNSLRETGLADLIAVRLSNVEGLELLERDQLQAITDEQTVQLFGSGNTAARASAGKVLKADALLLLSLDKGGDGEYIRFVVSDCRQGARLRTTLVRLDRKQLDGAAEAGAKVCLQTRIQFKNGIRWLAAVPTFASLDLDHRYDHLQFGYASLLKNSLIDVPHVAVIEIDEALAIRRELNTAGGELRDRKVPLYIEADYRTIRKEEMPTQVSFTVRITHHGKTAHELKSPNLELSEAAGWLTGELQRSILETVDSAPGKTLNSRQQFDALVDRAHTFAQVGSWEYSVGLREAAVLINEDADDQRLLLIDEYRRILESSRMPITREMAQQDAKKWVSLWLAGEAHLEFLIHNRRITLEEATDNVHRFLPFLARIASRAQGKIPVDAEEEPLRFIRAVMRVGDRLPSNYGTGRAYIIRRNKWWELCLDYEIQHVFITAKEGKRKPDFTSLLAVIEEWLPKEFPPHSRLTNLIYSMPRNRSFKDPAFREAYLKFLERLVRSERPLNQLYGKYGLLLCRYGSDDSATAERIAEIDELMKLYSRLEFVDDGYFNTLKSGLAGHRSTMHNKLNPLKIRRPMIDLPGVTGRPSPKTVRPDEFGRLRFKPLELAVKKMDGTQIALQWQGWRTAYGRSVLTYWTSCGAGLDLVWNEGAILACREAGVIEELFIDTQPIFSDISWDGEHIWIATRRAGVWIVEPSGHIVAKLNESNGLPPADNGIVMQVLEKGRVATVGSFGPHKRAWCAILSHANGKSDVNVFHRAVNVLTEKQANEWRAVMATSTEFAFTPSWIHLYTPPGQSSRLLIGRIGNPLQVDLHTLRVSPFPETEFQVIGAFSNRRRSCEFFSSGNKIFVANPRQSVYRLTEDADVLSKFKLDGKPTEYGHYGSSRAGKLVRWGDWLYCVNSTWSRINLETFEEERLVADQLPADYRGLSVFASSNYGLIAWGGPKGKALRVRIVDATK